MKDLETPPKMDSAQKLTLVKSVIRKATPSDLEKIFGLYKIVAQVNQGNLTQEKDEITLEYINEMLSKGLKLGLILVFEEDENIIGYLKAFTSQFRCLAHVLTNATMLVHPEWQGKGYGHQLLNTYLGEIKSHMPHILRFELLPHQGNQRAIKFYEKHGFVRESIARQKIRKIDGQFEPEVTLVWFNPNFSEESLKKYHAFLRCLIDESLNEFRPSSVTE